PAKIPNLLINGASGIAVGMATNIPPHNLGEVIDAIIHLIRHPEATLKEIMDFIPGPDFPTGGYIFGQEGLRQAYQSGKGTIILRARAIIERGRGNDRDRVVITELPFQVNKARLLENIAALVTQKKLEGIADIRDESDREGMRIVIEIKRGELPEIILNNLYKHTALQTSFGIILLAIVDRQPKVMSLIDMLRYFISHRQDIIKRRTRHDLKKAELRAHILEGLIIALDHLDAIIALIRSSRTVDQARQGLITKFHLTKTQAQAILEMQLQRLTRLERNKVKEEYAELKKLIAKLKKILSSEKMILDIIIDEIQKIKEEYADERKTEIMREEITELKPEDLIKEEEVVVTYTASGYMKRTSLSYYQYQLRGGKGRRGISMKPEDVVEDVFICSTHSYLLIITNKGKLYWLKALDIPDVGVSGRGKSINNLVPLEQNEKVSSVIGVKEFSPDQYVVMLTSSGQIKKTCLYEFRNIRRGSIIAINLPSGSEVLDAKLTDGQKDILIATRQGKAIRFHEKEVRPMGRTAAGVKAISLNKKDKIIGLVIGGEEEKYIFTISEKGYGKKTPIDYYPRHRRGGKGVINLKVSKKNGPAVGVAGVNGEDVILVTEKGKVIRIKTETLRALNRATMGVRIIQLENEDKVVSLAKVKDN
ncbi:MAG TPA: DNA gyrase subunit A, partial [Candidatus Aminicenantes bacterium]|nr:DNA gyrase subunit A [Candidatus Aminicenantes bacterium]